MKTIDLTRIREALPERAKVTLIKHKGKYPAIKCVIDPALSEEDFEMCKDWQREIIPDGLIQELYTEETGAHWYVFLKREQIEFDGVTDEDINSWTNMDLVEDGELKKP